MAHLTKDTDDQADLRTVLQGTLTGELAGLADGFKEELQYLIDNGFTDLATLRLLTTYEDVTDHIRKAQVRALLKAFAQGGVGAGADTAAGPSGVGVGATPAGVAARDQRVEQQLSLLSHLRSASAVGRDIFKQVTRAQKGIEPRFHNLRPARHRSVVSIQLAVPEFQHILSAAWGASEGAAPEPLLRDMSLANQLCASMSMVYQHEEGRVDALLTALESLGSELGLQLIKSLPDECVCDIRAELASSPSPASTFPLFVEVKHEMGASGDSGSDTGFRGVAHYVRYITQHTQLLASSFCPALLLEVVGALLRIQGLAFVGGHVVCEPLTPFFNLLGMHDRQPEQVLALARCCCALRLTASQLMSAAVPATTQAATTLAPSQAMTTLAATQVATTLAPSQAATTLATTHAATTLAATHAATALAPSQAATTLATTHAATTLATTQAATTLATTQAATTLATTQAATTLAPSQAATTLATTQAAAGAGAPGARWGNCATPMPYHLHLLVNNGDAQYVRTAAGDRLLYRARMRNLPDSSPGDAPRRVAIKYVRCYGKDVHAAWANSGVAPKLLRYQRLGAGPWAEVVMEWLDPQEGWLPLTAFLLDSTKRDNQLRRAGTMPAAAAYSFALASSVSIQQVQQLCSRAQLELERAHKILIMLEPADSTTHKRGAGYGVHGDMRTPNILLQLPIPTTWHFAASDISAAWGDADATAAREAAARAAVEAGVRDAASLDASTLRVAFVDFDWAGVEGVARYPAQMNPSITWPAGCEPGGPMKQQHDLDLLTLSARTVIPNPK